jgi:hypothetical protein
MEKSSVFEIGKFYHIKTMGTLEFHNSKIVALDNNFVEFYYKNEGLFFHKILNLQNVSSAHLEEDATKKTYWYFDKFMGDGRWGVKSIELTPEEYKLNKETGAVLFGNARDAKEYLFIQIAGGLQSKYFVWESDCCALYRNSYDKWDGKLATEYLEWERGE